jgi:arginine utilization protein RocB
MKRHISAIQRRAVGAVTGCCAQAQIRHNIGVNENLEKVGDQIKALAIELTKFRSVLGTTGEAEIAEIIYSHLQQLAYFRQHPENLRLQPVPGHPQGRKYVLAIVESEPRCANTVLCLGHIDTVGIDDYADLKQYATNPAELKNKLQSIKFSEPTVSELASDRWLVGRGILDMKTGIAAELVMVEKFANDPTAFAGNLVFAAVPDEEGDSAGMLAAVKELATIADARKWDFAAAVDTDYTTTRYPDDDHKYVYIGTVGKLLPSFYVYGEETHVGEAFNGIDANLLAAEIMRQIDLNTELCDSADGDRTGDGRAARWRGDRDYRRDCIGARLEFVCAAVVIGAWTRAGVHCCRVVDPCVPH